MDNLKIYEIIKENNCLKKDLASAISYRIAILSNATVNYFKPVLEYYLRKHGIPAIVDIGNYDNIVQDAFLCKEENMVIVDYQMMNALDKYSKFVEDLAEEDINALITNICNDIDQIADSLKDIPVVLFNKFSSYGVFFNSTKSSKTDWISMRLNEHLAFLHMANFHLINISDIISQVGITNAFDRKMYVMSKTVYSVPFVKEYVRNIAPLVFKYTGKLKKAIAFDCDNTLWKGILGEDGEDKIDMSPESKIGLLFHKVQQIAVWLANQGVIVCICSKNNYEDVLHVLNTHPDMILREDKITACRINWQDKATNLNEIAIELNIGVDSFVFVDDSDFEINLVHEKIPNVITFHVPTQLETYPDQLLKLINQYFYLSGSKDDIVKGQQYKQQMKRNEELHKFDSIDDYLRSLNIQVEVQVDDFSKIERIAQITQKTNQFNLTTKRYSEAQIDNMMKNNEWKVFSFIINDKFGNNGLTAVCICNIQGENAVIDSFIMSCRIMGRNIEYIIAEYVISRLGPSVKHIEAMYIPTLKNSPVEHFFDQVGFELELQDDSGNKRYQLSKDNIHNIKHIDYITIKNGNDRS